MQADMEKKDLLIRRLQSMRLEQVLCKLHSACFTGLNGLLSLFTGTLANNAKFMTINHMQLIIK